MAGFDNITAADMNAFDLLVKTSRELCGQDVISSLERGKRYLKTRYPIHCANVNTEIHSHSTQFALSDPNNVELAAKNVKIGDQVCANCLDLFKGIQSVINAVQNTGNSDLLHDASLAVNDIISFIKHIMRDAQQKKAKSESFSLLNDESCFWLKDYAQKILPLKFREGQKDYFGKKGMSMHIDVFFLKKGLDISKQVYLTVIYRCDQGMANTLSICENVLKEFKKTNPTITNIFTKSDNAGSYHGNCIFEGLFKVCKHAGFQLMRTDYNEPCRGKDQCDRESAAAKSIINSFVDAGNDLMTAEDVYKALHYGNGMQDTKVCVLQIDGDNTSLSGEAIRNVSHYHSIKYFEEYMLLW